MIRWQPAIINLIFIWFVVDLVLHIDGAVTTGSRLCVAQCALSSEEREKLATGNNQEELSLENAERYFRLLLTFVPLSLGQGHCLVFLSNTYTLLS